MTEEKQRIAIAEACGWKSSNPYGKWCHSNNWLMAKGGSYEVWVGQDSLPNYLSDLNAMHEAEKSLNQWRACEYHLFLAGVILVQAGLKRDGYCGRFPLLTATPQQRAEAFLRCLELWEEDDGI